MARFDVTKSFGELRKRKGSIDRRAQLSGLVESEQFVEQEEDVLAKGRVGLGLAPCHVETPVEANHGQVLHQHDVRRNLGNSARRDSGQDTNEEMRPRRGAAA